MAKANSFHQQTGLKCKAETSKGLHLEHSCVVLKRGHFGKVDQKYLESFAMWCWRRMEKISWTDRVRSKELFTQGQGGEEYPAYSKKREGYLDWSRLA
jgi:hypothetical protein